MSLSSGDANHVTSEQHDFCGIDQFTRSPFEPHVFLQLPELSAMAKHACATADNNDVIPLAMHLDYTRPNSPIDASDLKFAKLVKFGSRLGWIGDWKSPEPSGWKAC